MATYKCKNFGSCSRADAAEEFSMATGGDDKCPECGFTLVRGGEEAGDPIGGCGENRRKPFVIASVVTLTVLVIGGIGYSRWAANQIVVLKPDAPNAAAPSATASAPIASGPAASSVSPGTAEIPEMPAPMVANEMAARRTCEEATKAKQPDADKVCRRATAVTLMNSGVLSAIRGNFDQAEKDYLAAKDKDPEFPELYFNLALLKARQNKGSESIDNLNLASAKGFAQFSAIKNEPALQKLKSDPALKAKIEAFEAK